MDQQKLFAASTYGGHAAIGIPLKITAPKTLFHPGLSSAGGKA
jgi:hypothetical protein